MKNLMQRTLQLATSVFLLSPAMLVQADQVILDDLIVDGSICVGQDCVNGESFGFDTIRLKENNLRIRFVDTSSTSSFPSRDWQITVNDSANGGANKFSIDDIDGGRTPFTIEAGAPSHSLYVDDGGRLGLGTSTPVVDLHVKSGNTPTLRLEQDGSSGFTPQTWDVAGNEANFFVRDATNGSRLPFKIKPSAPSNSLYVASDGDVGFGTDSPTANLHVFSTVAENSSSESDAMIYAKNTSAGGKYMLSLSNNGPIWITLSNTAAGGTWIQGYGSSGNYFVKHTNDAAYEMELDSGGNMTILGSLTQASSRHLKENILRVDKEKILKAVSNLDISRWNYIHDDDSVQHIGPMSQDFYSLFKTGKDDTGISSIDASGIALASIQALNYKMDSKSYEIERLRDKNNRLEERLAGLETTIQKLTLQSNK